MRRTILTVALGLVVIAGGRVDAHPPWGIVVDPQGRVVFADIDHGNHIWRIDGTGKLTSLIEGRHSHDLHLAPDGTLFSRHRHLHHAWRTLREPAREAPAGRRADGGRSRDDGSKGVLGQRLHHRPRGERLLRIHEQPACGRGRGRIAAAEAEPGRPGHRPGGKHRRASRRQGRRRSSRVSTIWRGGRAACCMSPTGPRSARWPGTGPSPRWLATWWRRPAAPRRQVARVPFSAWRSVRTAPRTRPIIPAAAW